MPTYSTSLLPESTGIDLGSTGQRWDAFLQNLDVSGTTDISLRTLNTRIKFADQQTGADLGAQINAADTALGANSGEIWVTVPGTISTSVTLTANHYLRFFPGTFNLAAATINLSDFTGIYGAGGSHPADNTGTGTILKRTSGTSTMISAVGTGANHVSNIFIKGVCLLGNNAAGHGILLDDVDSVVMDDVSVRDGGASNALRVIDEAWDVWIVNCSLVDWGDGSNYTVQMTGSAGSITDWHWQGCQLGDLVGAGKGNPILSANTNVVQQRFLDCKFHTTGGTMSHMVDFSGYRSDFIGCTFQADTASSSAGMVRIKGPDNRILGGEFTDVNTGDAIRLDSTGGLILVGTAFRSSGAPGPGSAVAINSGSWSGHLVAMGNQFINLTNGLNITTGTGTVTLASNQGSGTTNPVVASASGVTWTDADFAKMTATISGPNLPTARSASTLNPTVRLGGSTATNSAGYQNLFLMPLFAGGGQINESLGMGTSWLAGIGSVLGTNIEHPILWGYNSDASGKLLSIYAKQVGTAITSGDEKAWVTTTGDWVGASFRSSAADPADAGVIRLANAEQIVWEASPAGTDVVGMEVDSSEVVKIGATGSAGVKLGANANTAAVTGILTGTASLDFDFSGAGITEHDLTITVTGAEVGDTVCLGLPAALQVAGLIFTGFVSATNTVTVRGQDTTSSGANPGAASVRATVIKF